MVTLSFFPQVVPLPLLARLKKEADRILVYNLKAGNAPYALISVYGIQRALPTQAVVSAWPPGTGVFIHILVTSSSVFEQCTVGSVHFN